MKTKYDYSKAITTITIDGIIDHFEVKINLLGFYGYSDSMFDFDENINPIDRIFIKLGQAIDNLNSDIEQAEYRLSLVKK